MFDAAKSGRSWMSAVWTTRQKWIATVIVVVLIVVPVIGLLSMGAGAGGVTSSP